MGLRLQFMASGKWLLIFILIAIVAAGPELLQSIESSTDNFGEQTAQETTTSNFNISELESKDSDNDGLVDKNEKKIGTDPNDPDTDGDGLLDGWEYRGETPSGANIPESDPLKKDIYLKIFYSGDVEPLSLEEKTNLMQIFGRMPVSNPDGSEGINLHIRDSGPNSGEISEEITVFDMNARVDQYYTEEYMGPHLCVSHQVLVTPIYNDTLAGFADTPGYQSVVDGTLTRQEGDYSVRVSVITHEILHNIVGQIGGEDTFDHTVAGWLNGHFHFVSPEYHSWKENQFLSEASESELEIDGFAQGC